MTRRLWLPGLLTLIGVAAAWQDARAFNARIDRPAVEETLAPGQAVDGTITVENQGDEPLPVDVYLQDWEYLDGGNGDKLFSAPGTSPWSASAWISYHPSRLTIPPRGTAAVEYTIRVPENARGGHASVLFFESGLGQLPPDQNGVTVQYTGRIGSLFEIDAAGTVQRAGEITELSVSEPSADRPLALTYTFRNTGNALIRPKAYFNIVDPTGAYLGRGEFPQRYTFPGRSGTASADWAGSLPPGDHTVLLTVDIGAEEPLVAEQPLRVGRTVVVEAAELTAGDPGRASLTLRNAGPSGEVRGTLSLITESGEVLGSASIGPADLSSITRRAVAGSGLPRVAAGPAYRCHVRVMIGDSVSEQILPCRAP